MEDSTPVASTTTPQPRPYIVEWIENEGLLRDEGCITGGAGQGLEFKKEAIAQYYQVKLAACHAALEQVDRDLERAVADHDNAEDAFVAAQQRCETAAASRPLRTAAGWLRPVGMGMVAVAVIVANYFLVASLTATYSTAWWLPAAIMGVGMFVLFGERTVWAGSDGTEPLPPPSRMRWLTELAPPIAAAVLVGCIACNALPLSLAACGSAFVLVLFLFCGKLLLATKAQLGDYHKAYRAYILACREHSRRTAACSDEKKAAQETWSARKAQLVPLQERRVALRATELALQAEALTKREIFLSEHALAAALHTSRPGIVAVSKSQNGHAVPHG